METFNKSLKYVPGLTAVHRTSLTGRRLAQRYLVGFAQILLGFCPLVLVWRQGHS